MMFAFWDEESGTSNKASNSKSLRSHESQERSSKFHKCPYLYSSDLKGVFRQLTIGSGHRSVVMVA